MSETQTPDETSEDGASHPVWTHFVRAGKNAADMAVDIAAIGAIAFMSVNGVEAATLQTTGAMVTTIAIGKRYVQTKYGNS